MGSVLSRAGSFVAIILMGYLLRRIGFFKREDFHLLSKIVIRITLTCAIITNFAGREIELSMLIMSVLGFGFGVLLMAVAFLLNRRAEKKQKAFSILNIAGCNIGNFALPFVQSFLGPTGVMVVSLFDAGNSFICLGGAYAIADLVGSGNSRFSFKPILKALIRSVPFDTYIIMTILALLHIALPAPVVEFTGIVGNANAFLAMLMIGVGFRLEARRDQISMLLRILVPRYLIGILLALLAYFVFPMPLEYRQPLAILFLSPIASAAPAFTAQMNGDFELSSAINSLAILTSIVLIVSALLLMA